MQTLTVLHKMGAGDYSIPLLIGINDFAIPNVAEYIATVAHESQNFTRFTENLNYSVDGLLGTFGRHRISAADARNYGRSASRPANQRAIANTVYGGQWGLQNLGNIPGSQDGWNFRGRGPIQITGRANYKAAGDYIGVNLLADPDLVTRDMEVGSKVAAWFWMVYKKLDRCGKDLTAITKKVNGGAIGLADRVKKRDQVQQLLSSPDIYDGW